VIRVRHAAADPRCVDAQVPRSTSASGFVDLVQRLQHLRQPQVKSAAGMLCSSGRRRGALSTGVDGGAHERGAGQAEAAAARRRSLRLVGPADQIRSAVRRVSTVLAYRP